MRMTNEYTTRFTTPTRRSQLVNFPFSINSRLVRKLKRQSWGARVLFITFHTATANRLILFTEASASAEGLTSQCPLACMVPSAHRADAGPGSWPLALMKAAGP